MNRICPNIVKLQSQTGELFSNLYKTTKCLLKLVGSLEKIFSTSFLLLKTNNRIWSPMFLTLNPFTTLHSGLKVLITASIFRALFVKNLAAIMNSIELCSLFRLIFPPPYHSVKERLLQCFMKESMALQKTHNFKTKQQNCPTTSKPAFLPYKTQLRILKKPNKPHGLKVTKLP